MDSEKSVSRLQRQMHREDSDSWISGFPETPCGKGSMMENTEEIRAWIPNLIEEHDIGCIADIGCGDQNWIHNCLPDGIMYDGFDIVPRQIGVQTFDVSREVLPFPVDLVLCIYVLNHMRPDMAERALRLIKESRSKFLLMSYSNDDQYSLAGAGELVSSVEHKDTGRHVWRYGLWRI